MSMNLIFSLLLLFIQPTWTTQFVNSTSSSTPCFQDCSGHGLCLSNSTCVCDFGYSKEYCQEDWNIWYWVYVYLFAGLFGLMGLISAIQLIRLFLHAPNCSQRRNHIAQSPIQYLLHVLFLVMAIGRTLWLVVDPHNLRNSLNPIAENIGNSLGIYAIVFAYLLVVLLWAGTYSKASRGTTQPTLLRIARPGLISMIIIFGLVEIGLRALWRSSSPSGGVYWAVIYSYYYFMLITVSLIMAAFLFYGMRIYRNLSAFQGVNALVQERLKKITRLTLTSSILCILTFISVLGTFLVELMFFNFEQMLSFIVEQSIFRILELCFVGTILYFLRSSAQVPENNKAEEQKLIPKESRPSYNTLT